jgi:DNA-binding PadR family transcriptional regulator
MERVLELAILGLLMDREHHGYEIRTHLKDRLGIGGNASFGSIYPAIARLEREGLIEVAATATEPRLGSFSTGSLSGERAALRGTRNSTGLGRRGRKSYRITELGRQQFGERLSDPATLDDARSFSLRMALFRFLTPNARVTLLEHRRANLVARLREIRANAANAELDSYARSVMEHAAKAVELDLAWIDDCLTTERSTAVPQNNQNLAQEAN